MKLSSMIGNIPISRKFSRASADSVTTSIVTQNSPHVSTWRMRRIRVCYHSNFKAIMCIRIFLTKPGHCFFLEVASFFFALTLGLVIVAY